MHQICLIVCPEKVACFAVNCAGDTLYCWNSRSGASSYSLKIHQNVDTLPLCDNKCILIQKLGGTIPKYYDVRTFNSKMLPRCVAFWLSVTWKMNVQHYFHQCWERLRISQTDYPKVLDRAFAAKQVTFFSTSALQWLNRNKDSIILLDRSPVIIMGVKLGRILPSIMISKFPFLPKTKNINLRYLSYFHLCGMFNDIIMEMEAFPFVGKELLRR